ncbi:PQQ-dependent sugar dehydrogenase [Olivibacter sp. XZL3]|uniref:PQQ-dependent sugar dehydrogenase n=1 Tax=Olivibacter sp. XZL3 TaxID=1735116 RepID=UPI001066AFBD|nr:PQQ-dependent sugar dehydrogenase [Olivibacter sp. XZL3]
MNLYILFIILFYTLTFKPHPQEPKFDRRILAKNLADPWEVSYGPDDHLWVTESKGYRILRIDPETGKQAVVLDLNSEREFPRYDTLKTAGKPWPQGGLMGMALHPYFLRGKPYVYIAFVYAFEGKDKAGKGCALAFGGCFFRTKIVRYRYNKEQNQLESPQTIDANIPGSNDHNGGRLLIAAQGDKHFLFYSVGDLGAGQFDNGGRTNHAQNPDIKEGKILRYNLEPDEDKQPEHQWIPNSNPFNREGTQYASYSVGHRNPQGLTYLSINDADRIYSCEHGPFSDDEINLIEAGKNYGHPLIIGYDDGNYNGLAAGASDKGELPGKWHTTYPLITDEKKLAATLGANYRNPLYAFNPTDNTSLKNLLEAIVSSKSPEWESIAPSSIEAYSAAQIPGWKNSLLITTLKAGKLIRLQLSDDGRRVVGEPEEYFAGKLRYRDLAISPDGRTIYLITDRSSVTSGPTEENPDETDLRGCLLVFTYR